MCGEPAVNAHHLSGRDLDGNRLDPDLVARLCHDCHTDAHDLLRAAEVDTAPDSARTPLGTVEHCLRRAASFFGQLCEHWPLALWRALASTVQGWADLLTRQRHLLDLHCPGWQLL